MHMILRAIASKLEVLGHAFQDLKDLLSVWIGFVYPDSRDVVNEFYTSTVFDQFSSYGIHSVNFPR